MTSAVIHEVTDPRFAELITSVHRSWFRLETLQHYDARSERAAFAAFRRGEPIDTTADRGGRWSASMLPPGETSVVCTSSRTAQRLHPLRARGVRAQRRG